MRVNFNSSLTRREVADLAKNPKLRVLQAAEPVDPKVWPWLNEELFALRPDVQFRLYGFYSDVCDLSFLPQMANVRDLAADCLMHATGVAAIASLPHLQKLSIGIYDLESFAFLHDISPDLDTLALQATQSKKPKLDALPRFRQLRTLYLEGQAKAIEGIAQLTRLEDVTLRSITVESLDFLVDLPELWSVDIKLGGSRNLAALARMPQVKYLEVWQVQKLDDLSPVSEMTGLQSLFLQSLPNVRRLPDLTKLTALRRIYLENMKGLEDLEAVQESPALEEFRFIADAKWQPEHFRALLAKPTLQMADVWFQSEAKRNEFERMRNEAGKLPDTGGASFKFR